MNEVFNIDQVSKYLDLHPNTVYKLCQEGKLPHSKLGRKFRFSKSAIDQMLANND